jgi:transposase
MGTQRTKFCFLYYPYNSLNLMQIKAPANSPDLNPIELVWADMKREIRSKMCTSLDEIKEAIGIYWRALTPEKCAIFIGSLKEVDICDHLF